MHPNETETIQELPSDEEVVARIKAWRVAIDHCIKNGQKIAHSLSIGSRAHEDVALSTMRLQEGKMWAGQALGHLGHKLPERYRDEA